MIPGAASGTRRGAGPAAAPMTLHLLDITGPVYLLIGLGYTAARMGWIAPDQVRALGRFVISFCVPAMLLRTLSHTPIERTLEFSFLGPYAIGSLLAMALVLVVARLALRRPMSLAAMQALGASGSNSLFIGFPILHQLIGPPAALALALVQVVENLLVIPLGLVLADAQAGHSRLDTLRRTLAALGRNPMVLGIGAGLLLSLLGWTFPAPVDKALAMLVGAAAPTALFVVGASLAGLVLSGLWRDLALVAGGKLLLHPLCVGLVLAVWHPPAPEMRVAALMFAAVPMMSIYPVLGQRHGHERFCAGALLAATLASIVTVNALIALLPALAFLR